MKYYKCLRCLLLLCAVCYAWCCAAQYKESTNYNIWSANAGDTFRVYSKTANIRREPDLNAAIQDSLLCGTPVIIRQGDTVMVPLKGIYAPWVKIQYESAAGRREGYVWEGLLALGYFSKAPVTLLYGLEKLAAAKNNTEENFLPAKWFIRVKAIDAHGTLLDEQEIKMDGLETSVCSGKLLGDMGLTGVQDIISMQFGGEACGIPTNYYYFGWTGSKLLPLPGKMEVGDAGVFYHTETFVFPKEQGGQPGKIIKLTEEGEADEEKVDKSGEPIFKIKKSREVYIWNGVKAVK